MEFLFLMALLAVLIISLRETPLREKTSNELESELEEYNSKIAAYKSEIVKNKTDLDDEQFEYEEALNNLDESYKAHINNNKRKLKIDLLNLSIPTSIAIAPEIISYFTPSQEWLIFLKDILSISQRMAIIFTIYLLFLTLMPRILSYAAKLFYDLPWKISGIDISKKSDIEMYADKLKNDFNTRKSVYLNEIKRWECRILEMDKDRIEVERFIQNRKKLNSSLERKKRKIPA